MKILLACDQHSSAEKIFRDFKQAAFPEPVEVFVLSVVEMALPEGYKEIKPKHSSKDPYFKHVYQEIHKAQAVADKLMEKLRKKFPYWCFHSEGLGGSPAAVILNRAKEWGADLIAVGSHGRIGPRGVFFGSVAMKVLAKAPCSVRIIRKDIPENDSPSRIIVGVDGSTYSEKLIDHLTARYWKKGTAVHLMTTINSVVYTAFLSEDSNVTPLITTIVTPDDSAVKKEWHRKGHHTPKTWIKYMHQEYKTRLEAVGLTVSSLIKEGDPKAVLLEDAKRWGADCIFVGAEGHSALDGFLVGSVSCALAARAPCSVEVIRNGA